MKSILIIEDKKSMADMLKRVFEVEGFKVRTASTVRNGISSLSAEGFDVIVTDLRLPDGEGMEVLASAKNDLPGTPVIMMTAFGNIETAVKAVKAGAYDFITKPFDPDDLLAIVNRAMSESVVTKNSNIDEGDLSLLTDIIGGSPAWIRVMNSVAKVARLKTTVLILGESGTGKELIARAIHRLSPRAKEAFIAVNCAAIPKDLIESEIFGHEKGAFTGAAETRAGRFELADRGTIFLDEIGDMELSLQAKLLRVLQESEFERVGSAKTIKIDLRVIAASNKNLKEEVDKGNFREDLFYRLNVFPVAAPPLRERNEDIIPLADHFCKLFSLSIERTPPSISEEVAALLASREWRGNVRELKNVMERAVILCDREYFLPEDFEFGENSVVAKTELDKNASLHEIAESATRTAEKAKIEEVLKETGGNKTRASEILKVSYKTLLTKIKEYGIV